MPARRRRAARLRAAVTGGAFSNNDMNSFAKILSLVRTRGPANGRDPTAVLILYSAKNSPQAGHCVAYRAPPSGGADWRHWDFHDAVCGVYKASDPTAVNHAKWKAGGSLAFFFLKLPVEDGPARRAATVAAVRRLGEYLASLFNSCGLAALLPVKPLFRLCWTRLPVCPGAGERRCRCRFRHLRLKLPPLLSYRRLRPARSGVRPRFRSRRLRLPALLSCRLRPARSVRLLLWRPLRGASETDSK